MTEPAAYPRFEGGFPFLVLYAGQPKAEAALDYLVVTLRSSGNTDNTKVNDALADIARYFDWKASAHPPEPVLPATIPPDYRLYTGCHHALHEGCEKCVCPTCGTPACQLSHNDGPKFWLPLTALFTALANG